MIPRTLDRRARAMFRAAVATFGLLAAVAPSHATSVVPLTIVDMLGHSDTIVMGQVLSVKETLIYLHGLRQEPTPSEFDDAAADTDRV